MGLFDDDSGNAEVAEIKRGQAEIVDFCKALKKDISELAREFETFQTQQADLREWKDKGQLTLVKLETALDMLQEQVTAITGRSNVSQTNVGQIEGGNQSIGGSQEVNT